MGQHSVSDLWKIKDNLSGVEQGGSEGCNCGGENGCRQNTHVEVEARREGSREHEPSCVSDWYPASCVCHIAEEFGILLGRLEAFVGVSEEGCGTGL